MSDYLYETLENKEAFIKSSLTLIGAGPGDPSLITLKGVQAIRDADVILYDSLCHPDLLNYRKPASVLVAVGKRHGEKSMKQEDINKLILSFAKENKNIVRLKGGDPFVFGRGFEEIELATKNNIESSVIPGVSSSYGALELNNIPLTARGVNESFFVVTGTNASCSIPEDLKVALTTKATIIILMGVHKLKKIVDIAQSVGKDNSPVAIIQDSSLPYEKIISGRINNIVAIAKKENIASPAIIVIGDVVTERDKLISMKKKARVFL